MTDPRNGDWSTPDYFFKRCDATWGPFGLDAAANIENKKCDTFINERADALKMPWGLGVIEKHDHHLHYVSDYNLNVWLNPPYRCLIQWVEKAIEEQKKGLRIVMLLPNDTDTRWFHMLMKRAEIYVTKGRVQFIDPEGNRRKSPRQGHIIAVLHTPVNGLKRMNGICGTIEAGA